MLHRLLLRSAAGSCCEYRKAYSYQQIFSLVNVKLKWAKDKVLDAVVAGEKDLKATCFLLSTIAAASNHCLPIYRLTRSRGQVDLPHDLKLSTFMRRYPNIFNESYVLDSGGTRVPCFGLTLEALNIHQEELNVLQQNEFDILDRLCKLLMLTRDRILPLQTVDQLKWDMGLPYDYHDSLILHHTELFSFVRLPDDRVGLKLLSWIDRLAISKLQQNAASQQREEDVRNNCLAFPIGFPRGFGLKRKCMEWLKEWQMLPYTSPYLDASHLDPRTDVSEKRIVGVFHELLHLTIQKKTERKNVSNLRKPLSLPQKFTKVFERHPGIFYISMKCDTQTVILREAYDRQQLLEKHPLVDLRERLSAMMKEGLLDRSRGVRKKTTSTALEDKQSELINGGEVTRNGFSSEEDLYHNLLSEYESDDLMHHPS
ncbi:PORR domain-containing protein [Cephalotus follicularis]|uniref:PORR domain-containing protein n=1 Tax=Cephalotus follicularis TaxID=3775 RepID=A0A1Q3DFU1_CEPFO|nr:PORR domain-containing protein [Cephalotus follicularis]